MIKITDNGTQRIKDWLILNHKNDLSVDDFTVRVWVNECEVLGDVLPELSAMHSKSGCPIVLHLYKDADYVEEVENDE